MNKREALKLKPGDLVIAPKFGIYKETEIARMLDANEGEGNHPLFELKGDRSGPFTYLGLQSPRSK